MKITARRVTAWLALACIAGAGIVSTAESESHIFLDPKVITETTFFGSVGLVSNCLTLKPAYLVDEEVQITVSSDGNCQEAELDWGDHANWLTLGLKGKTSETYTHTYTTPGVKNVRVVGTVGCVGMAATHVVVVSPSGPSPLPDPHVSNIYGPYADLQLGPALGPVIPYGYYLITGSGFGNQVGEVHMHGNFPGKWWVGPQNPYPGPWGPIPEGVLLNTFHWSEHAVAVYVPHMTGVLDQTVQLVVKVPSPNGVQSSAPFSTPFFALRETRDLKPEDVTLNCGPGTHECGIPGYHWAMSVRKKHLGGSGPPWIGTDTLSVQLNNGWFMKQMHGVYASTPAGTISNPSGLSGFATSATIEVSYNLPAYTALHTLPMHRLGIKIEGPKGVPHKGPYSATSGTLRMDVSKLIAKLGDLSSIGSEALADLEARFLALERREGEACGECPARRLTVQALRARLSTTRTDDKIHEVLVRHVEFLTEEAARL